MLAIRIERIGELAVVDGTPGQRGSPVRAGSMKPAAYPGTECLHFVETNAGGTFL